MAILRTPLAAVVALAAILAPGCREGGGGPAPAVDAELAACLTSDTVAVVGVDLDRLRLSPLYGQLPSGLTAMLEPLRDASYVLVVYDGREFLAAARGRFREPPAGSAAFGRNVAAFGPPGAVEKAKAQHATGRTGAAAAWLLSRAKRATVNPVWGAARGGVSFPLPGNASNFNRLFRRAEYESFSLKLAAPMQMEFSAAGATAEDGREIEETLRGLFSLAAAIMGSDPGIAAMLSAAQVGREGATVRAVVSATPEQVARIAGLATKR